MSNNKRKYIPGSNSLRIAAQVRAYALLREQARGWLTNPPRSMKVATVQELRAVADEWERFGREQMATVRP
jgi:hypothetical protein